MECGKEGVPVCGPELDGRAQWDGRGFLSYQRGGARAQVSGSFRGGYVERGGRGRWPFRSLLTGVRRGVGFAAGGDRGR